MNCVQKYKYAFFTFFITIVQYYNYSIFFISTKDLVINFFDSKDKLSSDIQFFTIFALSVFFRPIGSVAIAFIGDKIGRIYSNPDKLVLIQASEYSRNASFSQI